MSTADASDAVNDLEGTREADRTLVAMIKAAFPHAGVPDAAYERTARVVMSAAEDATWMRVKLASGLDSLEGLTSGRFAELSPDEALPVLRRIQHTPFFGFVRQTAVVTLYEDEAVWEALGYEGPSFDKGGYIDRGFDDLDWLPDPRIEEYDGEPMADIISDLPGTTGAAATRGAAVPVGQSTARAGRVDSGRTQQR